MAAPFDLTALRLVDHHCHGVLRDPVDRDGFESLLTEAGRPAPPGVTAFDSPVGFAVRRWCAPVLGLEPHAAPEAYLRRRAALGVAEVTRRLLRATGTAHFCVDTGLNPSRLLGPAEMAAGGRAGCHEVLRLEHVAEQVARGLGDLGGSAPGERYDAALRAELTRRLPGAVAMKSIIAYRYGLDLDPRPPAPVEVSAALTRWDRRRLEDPVLLRHALWCGIRVARAYGRPIQFHTGFGDPDLDLPRSDPARMTALIRAVEPVPVVLLHGYPYLRQAGYLATVFPHVYLDVGLTLTHTGAGAEPVLREALELAPFHKILYSSDGYGLPELHLLGAGTFRRALGRVLASRVGEGEWSAADAWRVAEMIAAGNATRLYGLPVSP
ncbi:MAG: amidohydrolase family protein [Streptosporangiales bacterium]|nr:amidohydrolase family protein [Streptosporangiales bacterium]